MARKDLSRTVIEGGRYHRNSWERRASHGVERASTRAWLDTIDTDEADASAPPPIKHVGKSFYDKLAPAMRWLASQVGRPWANVYSELRARFDSRTVAGRHVVEDHMLRWVRRHSDEGLIRHYRRFELYVDAHGILRKPKDHGRAYRNVRNEALAWAGGRVCARTYRGWWWFRPVMRDLRVSHYTSAGQMTAGEVRYLERLTFDMWRPLVIASPWPAQ